jgi:hypothetical protein
MKETTYSITVNELLYRPIISNDSSVEWLNKMTNEEVNQFDREVRDICLEDGVPNINSAILAKYIDRTILYKILKENE